MKYSVQEQKCGFEWIDIQIEWMNRDLFTIYHRDFYRELVIHRNMLVIKVSTTLSMG